MSEKKTNFAVVGISGRGSGMLENFLAIPGVRVVAEIGRAHV